MRTLATLLFLLTVPAFSAEVLDNAAVIRLVGAGLAPDVIVLKIEQSQATFDTSTNGLIALKQAHVPDAVIRAMLLKGNESVPATPAAPPRPATPPEPASSPAPLAAPLAAPHAEPAASPATMPASPAAPLTPAPPHNLAADAAPIGQACATVKFYTLGEGGWGWEPSYVCVSASALSVDEQDIALSDIAVHCTLKGAALSLGGSLLRGDQEWWFRDRQETFKFRGRTDDLERLAAALNNARRDVRRGGCSDRDVRKLLGGSY